MASRRSPGCWSSHAGPLLFARRRSGAVQANRNGTAPPGRLGSAVAARRSRATGPARLRRSRNLRPRALTASRRGPADRLHHPGRRRPLVLCMVVGCCAADARLGGRPHGDVPAGQTGAVGAGHRRLARPVRPTASTRGSSRRVGQCAATDSPPDLPYESKPSPSRRWSVKISVVGSGCERVSRHSVAHLPILRCCSRRRPARQARSAFKRRCDCCTSVRKTPITVRDPYPDAECRTAWAAATKTAIASQTRARARARALARARARRGRGRARAWGGAWAWGMGAAGQGRGAPGRRVAGGTAPPRRTHANTGLTMTKPPKSPRSAGVNFRVDAEGRAGVMISAG